MTTRLQINVHSQAMASLFSHLGLARIHWEHSTTNPIFTLDQSQRKRVTQAVTDTLNPTADPLFVPERLGMFRHHCQDLLTRYHAASSSPLLIPLGELPDTVRFLSGQVV